MSQTEYITVDSGERQTFDTGAVRDTRSGKGRFDLIPPTFLRRLAQAYERGAVKYGDRNWEKGMPFSRFLDSSQRHINDYTLIKLAENGRVATLPDDVDTREDHLIAAIWNLVSIVHFESTRPDLDDLGRIE